MAKWTKARRRAQSERLKAFNARKRKANGGGLVPAEQRLKETTAAHSGLRDALIADITDTLRLASNKALIAIYRNVVLAR